MKTQHKKSGMVRHFGTLLACVALIVLTSSLMICGQARSQDERKASDISQAHAAFERLKTLEGKWRGHSTKGWDETVSFKTIAAESVVTETSFEAHPNEAMMNMYVVMGSG